MQSISLLVPRSELIHSFLIMNEKMIIIYYFHLLINSSLLNISVKKSY